MARLTAVLVIDYSRIRLVLFEKKGVYNYYNEQSIDYEGFTEKGFVNPEDVFVKIQRLYNSAQEEFGVIDRKSTILLPGVFYRFGVFDNDIQILSGTVTANDAKLLLDECGVALPGYAATEKVAINYKSFTNPVMSDPVGEKTDKLYLTASVGYLMTPIKELIDNCAKKLNREFVCKSYCSVVADKVNEEISKTASRAIVILSDGHIDVMACSGKSTVDVRSVLWGEKHITSALAELIGGDTTSAEYLKKQANLNLFFDEQDKYNLFGKSYSVSDVNTLIIEALQFYAKEVARCIEDMFGEKKPPIYLTGSSICVNRGVREIFEEEMGRDVTLISSECLNLDGCADYVLISAIPKNVTEKNIFSQFISRFTNRRN